MACEEMAVTLVKSGFGVGGASLADVGLAARFNEFGHQTDILTGYIDPKIVEDLAESQLGITTNPSLDQRSDASPKTIRKELLRHVTQKNSIMVFSQALCEKETKLGEAAMQVAERSPVIFRQHNHLSRQQEVGYATALRGATVSVTNSMRKRFKAVNPNVGSAILPPLIDEGRFVYDALKTARIRRLVRGDHHIPTNAIVIFQPTRVSEEKGVTYSIAAAKALERHFPSRRVLLIVAGGKEQVAGSQAYEKSLLAYAESLHFTGLTLLNGALRNRARMRMADMIVASDVVACPSNRESFGLSIAEAALCRKPVLTRRYQDQKGDPVFDEVYSDFDLMVDPAEQDVPSDRVINELKAALSDPFTRERVTQKNFLLTQRYTLASLSRYLIDELLALATL